MPVEFFTITGCPDVDDFSQLASLPSLLKACLVNQHGEHHPDELMGSCHNRLFVAQPVSLSFAEIGPEEVIGEDYGLGRQPDHPSQAPVSSLVYFA